MSEENIQWNKVEPVQAETWDFDAQPNLIGEYVKKEDDVGKNNSRMYSFKQEDEKIVKVWGSTVLDSRMDALKIGDIVKIEYKGKETNPANGRTYKNFEVYVGEL